MSTIMLACVTMSTAQFYNTGADPFDVQWSQYRGEGYRWVGDSVVMPKMFLYKSLADSLVVRGGRSLGEAPRNIDVLLHSRTSYSNGVVAWAPKRMELYLTPSPSSDCVPWLQHLLVHEYRHVVQMSSLNRGFTKFLFALFGEQAIGLVSGLYVPKWFLEGDAVATETALTSGGRGRSSQFVQETRTHTLAGRYPKYDAAYNGSYADYYSNFYHMGYYTVAYLRYKYGNDFFASVLDECGRKSWSITPFNRELRRKTGKRKVALYNEAMEWWTRQWRNEQRSIHPTSYTSWSINDKEYANYHHPHYTNDNVVAYKETPEALSAFVSIDRDGKECIITTPTVRNETHFDYRDSLLLWTERRRHVRWENADNSVVMLHDMRSGRERRLTDEGFYTCADFSASGDRITVVRTATDARQYIEVLTLDGALLETIAVPFDADVSTTCLLSDERIVAVETTLGGTDIVVYDNDDRRRSVLIAGKGASIRNVHSHRNALYYTSDLTGTDNIYRYDLASGVEERVTSSAYGADMASVYGDTLLYADYTSLGYRPSATTTTMRPTDTSLSLTRAFADTLSLLEGGRIALNDTTDNQGNVSLYSKMNLFNLHSWGLINADVSSVGLSPSLSLRSQNLLGSMEFTAGLNYDFDDTEELVWAEASYTGLFPMLSLRATYGYLDYAFSGYVEYGQEDVTCIALTCDDRDYIKKLRLGITQPLQWNRGAWNFGLSASANAELQSNSGIEYFKAVTNVDAYTGKVLQRHTDVGMMNRYNYLNAIYQLSASAMRRRAYRDIDTRLGLSASLVYRHTPLFEDMGECRAAIVNLYLPGIGRHHSLNINASIQYKQPVVDYNNVLERKEIRYLGDVVNMPRGYESAFFNRLAVCKVNYSMPLLCPDWSVGPIVYVKRLWGKFFYDTSIGKSELFNDIIQTTKMSSFGVELRADTHWLRLPYNISLGWRLTYRNLSSDFVGGLLFDVSF